MGWNDQTVEFASLIGKTLIAIKLHGDNDKIDFCTDIETYRMEHHQDCCEGVQIEEIIGNLDDLIGSPIYEAEESSNSEGPKPNEYSESFTWTFYKLATIKGCVTIRWLGESNGYYSEDVNFALLQGA